MKKLVTALILIGFTITSIWCSDRFAASIDLGTLQDLIPQWSENTSQITVDARASFSDDFEFRVPLSLTFNERSAMIETGLLLVYYPWAKGPFAGLSLLQVGFIAGDATLEKNTFALNEALFGWTFAVTKNLFIEPSVSLRDPSGIYKDEYSALKGEYPCYKTVRLHLTVGWQLWSD